MFSAYNNKKSIWAPNQRITIISEDWSNECWKFCFAITRMHYIFKCIQIYFKKNNYTNTKQYYGFDNFLQYKYILKE